MDMNEIILDRIAFGGVKGLAEIYAEWLYNGSMQLLDWLANHLTPTKLTRWILIWLTVVIVGALSKFH